MRMRASLVLLTGLAFVLSGCAVTRQVADSGFRPPDGDYRLIVVQPDISVGILTAGGAFEPQAEWTNQARENVLKALTEQQSSRGGKTRIAATREDAGADPALISELIELHKAVGSSIQMHKYGLVPLPTKKDRFDWTLGESAVAFGASARYDYALFLHAEDSFSSGGRVALQVAGFLTCFVGVCVAPTGGRQVAYASLVDLKTGQVVWFNVLTSGVGDIRTASGAQSMVSSLLDKMKSGQPPKAAQSTSRRS